jgi:hypothetical protein
MTSTIPDRLHFPRARLAQQIIGSFEAGLQHAVTIFAPRRKGKTTFVMRDLIPLVRERGFLVATADLWLDRDNPERVIVRALQEAIFGTGTVRKSLMRFMRPGPVVASVRAGAGVDGGSLEAEFAHDQGMDLHELFLRFRLLGKGKALLIIDEVQHLATRKDFENLAATLRSLLQSAQGEVFALFTGSSQDGLAKMFRRSKAPFYRFSSDVAFPELGRDFVAHLGRTFHEVTGRNWEEDRAFDLYIARGQMPVYLRELYSLCIMQNLSVAEADKVVWKSLMDEGQFEALIQDLPALDQAVLVGILCGKSLFSSEFCESLADELPSRSAPTPQQVQSALNRLRRRDLVANTDRGTWEIEDGAVESYLRRLLIDGDID